MNEKVFIVGIELNNITAITKFENALNTIGEWKKVVTGLYAIKKDFSTTSDLLRQMIWVNFTNECQLFIMKTSLDAAWNLNPETDGWLRNNI